MSQAELGTGPNSDARPCIQGAMGPSVWVAIQARFGTGLPWGEDLKQGGSNIWQTYGSDQTHAAHRPSCPFSQRT